MSKLKKVDNIHDPVEDIKNDHALEICYYAMVSGKSYEETILLMQQAVIKKRSILDLIKGSQ